ncbi:MAG: cytochrome P450 [Pseudoclavibacter sp.]
MTARRNATAIPPSARKPPGPTGLPVLGSLLDYLKEPAGFLIATRYKHGPVSRMRMGPYEFTLATSPAATQHVLVGNHRNYRRGKLYKQFEVVTGRGLLALDENDWKPHRRVMQPAFMKAAMSGYHPHVRRQTEAMLERWRESATKGEPVELVAETLRLASSIIAAALFSFDIDDHHTRLKSVVDESIDIMFPHGTVKEMLPEWLPTARNRRIRHNRRHLRGLADEVRGSTTGQGEGKLLKLLEDAAARDDDPWDADEVRDEILTIYLAGHETTAVALCWSLLSVSGTSSVREQLEAEVDPLREVRFEDLDALTYTDAVVSEALRLYPPIWLFPRDAVDEDAVDGHRISAGSSVLLCPLITHRDPEFWESPTVFDPSRFLPGAPPRPRGAYFPFGLGARQCVGNLMAMMELKTVVASVAREFRLELLPSSLLRYGDSVISLRPMSEVWVRLSRREGSA